MMENVREYLVDIATEIVRGKKYSVRIDVDDGGDNSYISLCIDIEDFRRKSPVTSGLRLFRHSNSVSKLIHTWGFELGGVCNAYADYPDIPIRFQSYGVTPSEAESEAKNYFKELKRLIKKQTHQYKIEAAKSDQEELEKLTARLNELTGVTHDKQH